METPKGAPLRFENSDRNFGRDPLKDERKMGNAEADALEALCRRFLQY
jgi:hypothetical protein